MRRLIAALLVLCGTAFAGTCGNGYSFSRKFVVTSNQVLNTDQTNFPVGLAFNGASPFGSILLSDLKTVANGGQIQNTAANVISVTGPADLIFCDASSAGNALKFEIASYSASTGAMEAYVKIATLSHTTNNSFWMFYGNASVSTSQQDLSMWADANYKQVCHLPDGSSFSPVCSVTGFTQTNHSVTATTGAIDGAGSFASASSRWVDLGSPYASAIVSVEAWIKPNTSGASDTAILDNQSSGPPYNGYDLRIGASGSNLQPYFAACDTSCDQKTGPAIDQSWHQITGTFASTTATLYIDSVVPSTSDFTYAATSSTSQNLIIGAIQGGSHYFDGTIDEARVSSVARSADWIRTNYNNQVSPSGFSAMIDPSISGARVVQYATCRGTSPVSCAFPNNVTSGNSLVIASNVGENGCHSTDYSDTLTSSLTLIVGTNNLSLGDANSCIYLAQFGSSGAETVTWTNAGSPKGGMVVYEIAGMGSPSLDASNTNSTPATTITTPSVTASTGNSLLICGSGVNSNITSLVQTFSPSASVALDINNVNPVNGAAGSAIIQFTGSGSKSCSFTFGTSPNHASTTIAVIKYSPTTHKLRPAIMY